PSWTAAGRSWRTPRAARTSSRTPCGTACSSSARLGRPGRRPGADRRRGASCPGSTLSVMTSSTERLFTSESVTEGHPDKVCDQISDAILDAILEQDPLARVAVETMVTTGLVHVAGEVTTSAYVEIPAIVRQRVRDIGYT